MIDDAFHFTIAHQFNISMFLKLTNYLRQETDYTAWYPMTKIFEYISNAIPLYTHSTESIIMVKIYFI